MVFCLAFVLVANPVLASQTGEGFSAAPMELADVQQEINVTASGNSLRVVGAAKLTLSVYYLTGTRAAVFSLESDDQTVSTNLSKGVYLVKVGKFVRKITLS